MKILQKEIKVLFYSEWDSIVDWQKVFLGKNIKLLNWPNDFKNKYNKKDICYAIVWDPPNELFNDFPNLKLIQSLGAGVDHILTKNFPKNCVITRLEDPDLTNQMTEYALLSVLMCYRRYFQYNKYKNNKNWNQIVPFNQNEFKITILGYGTIAKNICKELSRFGFNINIWANSKRKVKNFNYYYGPKQLKNSVKKVNCLINLLPTTTKTFELINLKLFNLLANECYFINIGRGKTVNEKDLILALQKNIITAAVLDVFKNEPLKKSNKLWQLENVFITPHIAGVTHATKYAADTFLKNIESLNTNKKILNKISINKQY